MPLVRIDLRKGKDATYLQQIGRVVYEALVGVGVPNNDLLRSLVSTTPKASCSTPIISVFIAPTNS